MLRSICGNMMRWRRRLQRSISRSCGDARTGAEVVRPPFRSLMGLSCATAVSSRWRGRHPRPKSAPIWRVSPRAAWSGWRQTPSHRACAKLLRLKTFVAVRQWGCVRARCHGAKTVICAQPIRSPLRRDHSQALAGHAVSIRSLCRSYAPARPIISNSFAVKATWHF
jgi:hypothetical protein